MNKGTAPSLIYDFPLKYVLADIDGKESSNLQIELFTGTFVMCIF